MKVDLTKTFRFESAHFLPSFPEGHKCRRMHGHSFVVDIVVSGEVPPERGYLIDYGDVMDAIRPVKEQLDHRVLNDIEGLSNPTAEVLSIWLWKRLKPILPLLSKVCVHETCNSACEYRGE